MRYLGIDPGIIGGLAIIDVPEPFRHAELIDATDVPIGGAGASKRVNVVAVFNWLLRHKPALAFIERAGLYPGQSPSAGGTFMRATGMLEGAVILAGIPLHIVEAATWKKRYGLPGKATAGSVAVAKEMARQRAIEAFGSDRLLDKKSHHGRAEAALIALYGAEANGVGNAGPADGELSLYPGERAT